MEEQRREVVGERKEGCKYGEVGGEGRKKREGGRGWRKKEREGGRGWGMKEREGGR